jgi:hypothetical protein
MTGNVSFMPPRAHLLAKCSLALLAVTLLGATPDPGWTPLFDGKSLDGWTPKIKGYPLGENFGNTFRVKDGAIQVGYEGYAGKFNARFGHLFHRTPQSNYVLRLEYRFIGEQIADGPGWAWRNSGVMIHGQPPETMRQDQDFPVSAEIQLLGGPEEGDRPTANLCTPGTNVVMDGKLITQHCTNSNSPTLRGDQWVQLEIEVRGSGLVIHRINGNEVMRYEQIQYDPRDPDAKALMKGDELKISGGSISLQSESHPVEFRNLMIRPL